VCALSFLTACAPWHGLYSLRTCWFSPFYSVYCCCSNFVILYQIRPVDSILQKLAIRAPETYRVGVVLKELLPFTLLGVVYHGVEESTFSEDYGTGAYRRNWCFVEPLADNYCFMHFNWKITWLG